MRIGRAPALLVAALLSIVTVVAAELPTPDAHFGFRPGSDRRLATADAIDRYFELVAAASDRVDLIELGPSTEGHRTIAAVISTPENLKNLAQIRAANAQLADPRRLTADQARQLAATQKVIVAIGASIHASEIGATQASSELLYTLATATDPATVSMLPNVVILLIPSLNPDGARLVTEWYEKTKGTPWEGMAMPWLYHKYAGHDINRDAFMMNLAENRNLARLFYSDWHPQVFLTMHQMEENGPRFFVPPNTDPIDPNSDPLIWRSAALLGSAMALELQRDRRSGVVSSAKYDYYWPGFEDSAPIGHNIVCLLTEVASANIASPINVPATELRAGFKGLPDYRPQINFPDPWPGGRWTLRDIIDYDLSAVRGLLFAAGAYRQTLVQNFYDMGRRAVDKGREGGPFAFMIPREQRDLYSTAKLEELLLAGGVEIQRAIEPFRADGDPYPEGTDIIFLSQPYRAYIKTLLERQSYPARRTVPGGAPERPYDVAGWTLPLQMGVNVITVERTFEPPSLTRVTEAQIPGENVWGERKPTFWVVDGRGNGAALAVNRLVAAGVTPSWTTTPFEGAGFQYEPGAIIAPYVRGSEDVVARIARDLGLRVEGSKAKVPASDIQPIGRARIALYRPWTASIDEGWTRLLLDRYEFKYATLTDQQARTGNLRAQYDAIILPNVGGDRLAAGLPEDTAPPEYVGGLGAAGVDALRTFVRAGGTLICLGQSSSLAIGMLDLPVRDIARENDRLFVPGSIVRLSLDPTQPLAFGMPRDTSAFFTFSSVFSAVSGATSRGAAYADPSTAAGVRTIGHYGDHDVLLSGWLEGEDLIAGRAAIVDAAVGSGHVILFGFPVQHRAQSYATFRLLYNALFSAPQPPLPKGK